VLNYSEIKRKSQGGIACMEEVAVSVLLKLIIDGNERCQQ